jgi:hypothetical protein
MCYNNLVEKEAITDYEFRALTWPSFRIETELPTARTPMSVYEDAAFVASQAEGLADQDRDVVIISQSHISVCPPRNPSGAFPKRGGRSWAKGRYSESHKHDCSSTRARGLPRQMCWTWPSVRIEMAMEVDVGHSTSPSCPYR